jgi:hypothetical protein
VTDPGSGNDVGNSTKCKTEQNDYNSSQDGQKNDRQSSQGDSEKGDAWEGDEDGGDPEYPPLADGEGFPIPDRLRDVFASKALLTLADEVAGFLEALGPWEAAARRLVDHHPYLRLDNFLGYLREIRRAVSRGRPGRLSLRGPRRDR